MTKQLQENEEKQDWNLLQFIKKLFDEIAKKWKPILNLVEKFMGFNFCKKISNLHWC